MPAPAKPLRAVRRREREGRLRPESGAPQGSPPSPRPRPASCRRPAGKWPAPERLRVSQPRSPAQAAQSKSEARAPGPRAAAFRAEEPGRSKAARPQVKRATGPALLELPGKPPVFFTDHQPQEPHRSGPEAVSNPPCPSLCAGHTVPGGWLAAAPLTGARRFQPVPGAAALDGNNTNWWATGARVSGTRTPGPAASSGPSSPQSPGRRPPGDLGRPGPPPRLPSRALLQMRPAWLQASLAPVSSDGEPSVCKITRGPWDPCPQTPGKAWRSPPPPGWALQCPLCWGFTSQSDH